MADTRVTLPPPTVVEQSGMHAMPELGAPGRRRWPLLLIGASAGTATWSGWVGLGELTGFGVVHPLPGIWDDLTLNTAITLPIGVEAYAVYALAVATDPRPLTRLARRWAWASAAGALLLGMGGQIAYHLLAARDVTTAPAWVVALVSSLPVLVLGAASLLWHLAALTPVSGLDDAPTPARAVPVSVVPLHEASGDTAPPSEIVARRGGTSADSASPSDRPRTRAAAAVKSPRPSVTATTESRSDESIVAVLAAVPEDDDLPSIRTVMRAHGIGQARATRLVRAAAARREGAAPTHGLEGPTSNSRAPHDRPDKYTATNQTTDQSENDGHHEERENEPEEIEEETAEEPEREEEREIHR